MSELELILSICVVLLIFLNLLQLNINQNFNKRFTIVGDWLIHHDRLNVAYGQWVDSVTEILVSNDLAKVKGATNVKPPSTTQNTQTAKTEARTC